MMKKVSPAQFIRQVKQELTRIFWPTSKETLTSAGMVFVMVAIVAAFLSIIDWGLSTVVRILYTIS